MRQIKHIGLAIFLFSFVLFVLSFTFSNHQLNETSLNVVTKPYHKDKIKQLSPKIYNKTFTLNAQFINKISEVLQQAKSDLDKDVGVDPENGIWNATSLPEGAAEWDVRMSDYDVKNYIFLLTKSSSIGLLPSHSGLFFFLIFILGSIGALMYILPDFKLPAGIKNNHLFHNSVTRGTSAGFQFVLTSLVISAVFVIMLMEGAVFYFVISLLVASAMIGLIFLAEKKALGNRPKLFISNTIRSGWIGISLGFFLIGFYIILYFYPQYITNWIILVDPIKQWISGGQPADRWFLYGFLYCLVMLVMGIRMIVKYRHNTYQIIRTCSVIFFQLAFAFIIPEILGRFNNPAVDLKNAWPLDYSFFYDYRVEGMLENNTNYFLGMNVGTMMFVWGIVLTLIVVPLFTYLYGKRWYCSWVCGCGGLAETLGDPFRQQSDKRLRAWRIERYLIHSVLILVCIMTGLMIYHSFSGQSRLNLLLFELDAYQLRSWYGFMIGSMFAGVVGTGFYPLMGNRVWCRFGCPLAALMGIVQRFKSRFRITTNGGQCISCGNCSTYCEMGIDVRSYAQKGQDIVRASCVGCGVCSAVCPRGVLRLENASSDMNERTEKLRTVHVKLEDVGIL